MSFPPPPPPPPPIDQIATVNAVTHTRRQSNKDNSCSASAQPRRQRAVKDRQALTPQRVSPNWRRAEELRRAAGRLLVAEIHVRDLLLCAKHLFVAAIRGSSTWWAGQKVHTADRRSSPWGRATTRAAPRPSPVGRSTIGRMIAMPDPVSRLQVAQAEIDRVLGDGYARANPQVVSAVMISASPRLARR